MKIYVVAADHSGAFVDSGYASNLRLESSNWIAVFHDLIQAQAFVSHLNQTYAKEQLKGMVKS